MTRGKALEYFAVTAAVLALHCLGYYLGAHAKHPNNVFGMFGICVIPAALLFVVNLWRSARPPAERDS